MKAFIDANLPIYLLVLKDEVVKPYRDLYLQVIEEYDPFTDPLIIDEILWICKRKYKIPYDLTSKFVEDSFLKVTSVLDIGEEDVVNTLKILSNGELSKPSDALHLAVMRREGISIIISEDTEFDNVKGIKRIWLK